jgi:hypothetical protein
MGAMKPRTSKGPIEVVREGRHYVMRIPMDDGDRLVIALAPGEAEELGQLLAAEL